ncbi:hypothetical protein OUY22_34145 [Nonomuraea sp. MCN248]|uniref:Uncharacterized protein n=1 Tax=Nonomuraea corallina TaxID=2989783 RepID=A0ABT4SML4_9ACTN|nr:hypothetical protein [Nonomuraea corallina]MDA0638476.1 hypothetical protein [Nonomuraea corallina]
MTSSWNLLNIALAVTLCVVPMVGIVLTAMGRRVHGRAATLGLLGCVALLLQGVLHLGQTLFLNMIVQSVGLSGAAGVMAVLALLSFVLTLTGLSLLIWAVVARRPGMTPQPAAPAWQQPQAGPQQPGPHQPGWAPQPGSQAGPYRSPQPHPYQGDPSS